MRLGILPLGRPTFDVEYANEKLAAMLAVLEQTGNSLLGPRQLLFDESTAQSAAVELQNANLDQLLLLQVTFTDASMTVAAAEMFDLPLSIWAIREPRAGGRLRLNSFCGLNLASHALSLKERKFSWLYTDPDEQAVAELQAVFRGERYIRRQDAGDASAYGTARGAEIAESLKGKRVARIGEHPVGFDTCAYSARQVNQVTGIGIDALPLSDLFDNARAATAAETAQVRQEAEAAVDGLHGVDQRELNNSLRLKAGLERLRTAGQYDAFAIRCWPETFTEYGGAVCGPMGMMAEAKVPCACEADVLGAVSQMILQEVSSSPVFLSDLVDIDHDDNTAVLWHCGQAPISMLDPEVQAIATIHTNRKMPLLYEFTLKPGPVTLLRLSQSHNRLKMVLASAEVLRRPMAFTGTSAVIRYQQSTRQVLSDVLGSGLEHHMVLAYGDHRDDLRAVAAAMQLPLLEI